MADGSIGKRPVLVAPLDWGLGHAGRCVPIVRALREHGARVILGGEGRHMALLTEEFPDLPTIPLVNYDITYGATILETLVRFPFMLARVFRCAAIEHRQAKEAVDKHGIGTIISDQRFGCHVPGVHSIYITHQLCLKMPRPFRLLEPFFHSALLGAALEYDRIWLPDFDGDKNLTGDLTRRYPVPSKARFIGPLSRLGAAPQRANEADGIDLLVMLSGPEPQRSILERKVFRDLQSFRGSAVVLLGRPGTTVAEALPPKVTLLPHAPAEETAQFMRTARTVVCRAGYTTIMELAEMGRGAVLVPTPGQTEQEYLARHLDKEGGYAALHQGSFSIEEALNRAQSLANPSWPEEPSTGLEQAVELLLGS